MDGARVFTIFQSRDASFQPWEQETLTAPGTRVWGCWLWKKAKSPRWELQGDPKTVSWEMQCWELSLARAQQQREGDLCWGQPEAPLGRGKDLEQGGMGCRAWGLPRTRLGWDRTGLALLAMPGVQISRD